MTAHEAHDARPVVAANYRTCPRCTELEAFPELAGDRHFLPALPSNRHVLMYIQHILIAPDIPSWNRICAIRSAVERGVGEMEGERYRADRFAAAATAAAAAPAPVPVHLEGGSGRTACGLLMVGQPTRPWGAANAGDVSCADCVEISRCPNCGSRRTGDNAAGPPTHCAACNEDDGSRPVASWPQAGHDHTGCAYCDQRGGPVEHHAECAACAAEGVASRTAEDDGS